MSYEFSDNDFDPRPLIGCSMITGGVIALVLLVLARFLINHVHIAWH